MNIEMIIRNFGKVQIKLPAMTGKEFRYFIDSLDFARYGE
jgi:hypothetical protein